MVSILGMLLVVHGIPPPPLPPYRTRFYISIMQLALKYGVLPVGSLWTVYTHLMQRHFPAQFSGDAYHATEVNLTHKLEYNFM